MNRHAGHPGPGLTLSSRAPNANLPVQMHGAVAPAAWTGWSSQSSLCPDAGIFPQVATQDAARLLLHLVEDGAHLRSYRHS